jgi:hypothetical protein
MANGDSGGSSFVIGGVSVSNTAIVMAGLVVGAAVLVAALSGVRNKIVSPQEMRHGGEYSHQNMRNDVLFGVRAMAADKQSVDQNADRIQNHAKRMHGMTSDLRRQLIEGKIDKEEFDQNMKHICIQVMEDLEIPTIA